ncbi:hypothetical protein H9Y04_24600 [Streptomyces sp. TRM66268-LWL]|uniref:Uncharacterized protein n=1 Tax=Streptomyces polyasparticus TaxID=2767826 RepID=A0ABR7SJW4_9ACTN|nr:hypothetical protein [Streptomyces polyasparticus]MBC9715728.1 hypothetical protein [Streptomyces polyasparticus]
MSDIASVWTAALIMTRRGEYLLHLCVALPRADSRRRRSRRRARTMTRPYVRWAPCPTTPSTTPRDLLDYQRDRVRLDAEIDNFPLNKIELTDGTPLQRTVPEDRVAAYDEGMTARIEELREQRRKVVEKILTHSYWGGFSGADVVKARSGLKTAAASPAPAA